MPKMFSIAGEIARDRKSILGHLGRSGTFLKTLLDFGTAASEVSTKIYISLPSIPLIARLEKVHPVAKAVLASVNTVYNVRSFNLVCIYLYLRHYSIFKNKKFPIN